MLFQACAYCLVSRLISSIPAPSIQCSNLPGRGCKAIARTEHPQHHRAPVLPARNVHLHLGTSWYVQKYHISASCLSIINFISTSHPSVKLEDGAQHKNLRIFSVSTGEELVAFTQKSQEGWDLQYTISESHAVRLVSNEVQIFRPAEWAKGVVDKLKVEGASMVSLSSGLSPSFAVFVAEKKVRVWAVSGYAYLIHQRPTGCPC